MLVYRLTVQRQKSFYSGGDIRNETGLRAGEEWLRRFFSSTLVSFLVDLSRSISEDGRFFFFFLKTK